MADMQISTHIKKDGTSVIKSHCRIYDEGEPTEFAVLYLTIDATEFTFFANKVQLQGMVAHMKEALAFADVVD